MVWTAKVQENLHILIGIFILSYVIIFLIAPREITDFSIADTEYWRETENRLLLKTAFDYNNKEEIKKFPDSIGEWNSFDFKYPDSVYTKLDAEIMLSRAYSNKGGDIVWMDIINSKVGESFHNQRICVEGAGWNVDNQSIAEFKVAENPLEPFVKLNVNRIDISKGNKRQVMIYWFIFKKLSSDNSVTMIRLSSPVVNNETQTYNSIKGFVENNLFDAMYESVTPDSATMGSYIIEKYGTIGIVLILIAVLFPIGLIFTGMKRKKS